jgi:hypothetical protein
MRYSCQQQHCGKHDEIQTACAGARLQYRRIDGGSSLEEREKAIQDFNAPKSQVFIFLLSIRAAGRGLNLQTADTVVMYDPDPNPKNEEQAIARSHRIGQTKPVRVVHLETVADAPPDARALDDPDYNDDGPWSSSLSKTCVGSNLNFGELCACMIRSEIQYSVCHILQLQCTHVRPF